MVSFLEAVGAEVEIALVAAGEVGASSLVAETEVEGESSLVVEIEVEGASSLEAIEVVEVSS